jgi:uncharacterized protein (TIGR02145 family)
MKNVLMFLILITTVIGVFTPIRAYAQSPQNTSQTVEVVKDIDGNVYNTTKIDRQIWMAENLKTTKFNDGTPITLITDSATWANLVSPGYCWYNNDQVTYKHLYGALYNWYTVNKGKLCPTGWHVPADEEWTVLTTYLGGEGSAGPKLKECGKDHWISNVAPAMGTNATNFTALPGGNRYDIGIFINSTYNGFWWSATESSPLSAWSRVMYSDYYGVVRGYSNKKHGFSVRCLKD